MNITPINYNYSNNTKSSPAFGAKLGDFEPLIKALNKLDDEGNAFFKYMDKHSNRIKSIKYKNLEPKINIETNERNEEIDPLNMIVFSDLSEDISGDTVFKYIKSQSGEQNGRRFISALRRATKNMQQYPSLDKKA